MLNLLLFSIINIFIFICRTNFFVSMLFTVIDIVQLPLEKCTSGKPNRETGYQRINEVRIR